MHTNSDSVNTPPGIATPAFAFSIFASTTAINTVDLVHNSWDDLVKRLRSPEVYSSKRSQPLLKLAQFGNRPNDKGSLRYDANVERVFGLEGDYDAEVVSPEQGAEMLRAAGIRALVYTSASHTTARPRWRVLAPLARPIAPAERSDLLAVLNGALGGILAAESWRLSQTYYFGSVVGVSYTCIASEGCFIDQIATLGEIEPIGCKTPVKAAMVFEKGRRAEDVNDPAVAYLDELNLVTQYAPDGKVHVRCPWSDQHTTLNP